MYSSIDVAAQYFDFRRLNRVTSGELDLDSERGRTVASEETLVTMSGDFVELLLDSAAIRMPHNTTDRLGLQGMYR